MEADPLSVCSARKRACRAAKCGLFIFLGDDDVIQPLHVERSVVASASRSQLAAVLARTVTAESFGACELNAVGNTDRNDEGDMDDRNNLSFGSVDVHIGLTAS